MTIFQGPHEHPLTKMENPGVHWGCNGCSRGGANCLERHKCPTCDYDYCEQCLKKSADDVPAEAKLGAMVLLDLPNRKFYRALEGSDAVTSQNMLKMWEDFNNGALVAQTVGSDVEGGY